jgi:hypothetical protein
MEINTYFRLKDGRLLDCTYSLRLWYSVRDEEEVVEVGDPAYTLDGEPVELDALPRGLYKVANRLYMANQPDYGYTECMEPWDYQQARREEEEPEEPEYEYERDPIYPLVIA